MVENRRRSGHVRKRHGLPVLGFAELPAEACEANLRVVVVARRYRHQVRKLRMLLESRSFHDTCAERRLVERHGLDGDTIGGDAKSCGGERS